MDVSGRGRDSTTSKSGVENRNTYGINLVIEQPLFTGGQFIHSHRKSKILKERSESAIASESSLKKDWLRPEEDEAWQDL